MDFQIFEDTIALYVSYYFALQLNWKSWNPGNKARRLATKYNFDIAW